jgi:hypothetical protein
MNGTGTDRDKRQRRRKTTGPAEKTTGRRGNRRGGATGVRTGLDWTGAQRARIGVVASAVQDSASRRTHALI